MWTSKFIHLFTKSVKSKFQNHINFPSCTWLWTHQYISVRISGKLLHRMNANYSTDQSAPSLFPGDWSKTWLPCIVTIPAPEQKSLPYDVKLLYWNKTLSAYNTTILVQNKASLPYNATSLYLTAQLTVIIISSFHNLFKVIHKKCWFAVLLPKLLTLGW